jgi:hypothetical protein
MGHQVLLASLSRTFSACFSALSRRGRNTFFTQSGWGGSALSTVHGVRDLIHFRAFMHRVGYLAAVSLIFTGRAESNVDIGRNCRPF